MFPLPLLHTRRVITSNDKACRVLTNGKNFMYVLLVGARCIEY